VVDYSLTADLFIYGLDLFGTMAFAVTGAFKAIEKRADIVGVLILATITGLAGGTIRDVVLGQYPNSLADPAYVTITAISGACVFFMYGRLKKHLTLFLKFDAIGLGVFSIIGATVAYNLFGMNFLVILLAGVLTAVGGGILRDVFVNDVPIVFVKELYATASFAGVVVFFVTLYFSQAIYVSSLIGIALTIGLRMLAMKYNWNLPRVRYD